MGEIPYSFCYILFVHVLSTNSRTSSLWKLNVDSNKIVEANNFQQVVTFDPEADPIFNIITSTVHAPGGGHIWAKHGSAVQYYYCTDCNIKKNVSNEQQNDNNNLIMSSSSYIVVDDDVLDCGKSVNFTYYDNLVGVANRHRHPNVPEPQVAALIFTKRKSTADIDVNALERRLKKAKREKPKSVSLYNQIGNFWRIKGDAHKSIECFRRALAVSPHNADVLLNLARVLFALQYLDDAIYLTRRSLEVQPADRSAWQQYFTLGEILKAYGHYQEASVHLRHALELRPDFEPALLALHDMESVPEATIHVYTLLIIVCLVLGVLLVILSSVDSTPKTIRHNTMHS